MSRHDSPDEWVAHMTTGPTWRTLGARLWLMLVAHRVTLGAWPSCAKIQQVGVERRAELHEELRVRNARHLLGGGL